MQPRQTVEVDPAKERHFLNCGASKFTIEFSYQDITSNRY